MFQGGYGFNNAGQQQFNNQGAPQQQGGQPNQQQMMFNQQQQFAGMGPQGGFNPGANPQMMHGGPQGMMPNQGVPNMPPNGQSTYFGFFFLAAHSGLLARLEG